MRSALLLLCLSRLALCCETNLDCSLNGLCQAKACVCDAPWAGDSCERLLFKTTPAGARNLFPTSDPRNTWNAPIVADGSSFHMLLPVYTQGSLSKVELMKHGVASSPTGPYDWTQPDLNFTFINPAFIVFNKSASERIFSLWGGGKVYLADSIEGPFVEVPRFSLPGGNAAPIYYKGAFYTTTQFTTQIWRTDSLSPDKTWSVYANISHKQPNFPVYDYHVEDPFLWVDQRGNWHIINHAYSNVQYTNCSGSDVSAHFFSEDGIIWSFSQQPYGHTVNYDDGSSHTYVTLERPNLHFDAEGTLTHINLAADLVTGDEGCPSRTSHAHFGHCPCDNCKWDDHAGTTIIALGKD
jgi:hypothetical protein